MGQIDAYIHHLATPLLAPGESVLGAGAFAVVTATTHGVPAAFDLWLAAMTPTRMLCFRSSPQPSGMLGYTDFNSPPRMESRAALELRYEWILSVSEQPARGKGIEQHRRFEFIFPFALFPVGLNEQAVMYKQFERDPNRRVVSLECLFAPSYDGLDGQRDMHARFVPWLWEQQRLGAFAMSAESLARVEADLAPLRQAAAQAAAQREQSQAARAAWWARSRHRVVSVALAVPLVLGVIYCGQEANQSFRRSSFIQLRDPERRARYSNEEQSRGISFSLGAVALGVAALAVPGVAWRRLRPRAGLP